MKGLSAGMMTENRPSKAKLLSWIPRAALALFIASGMVFWFYEYRQQRPVQAQWREYLQANGNLPAARSGEIVVLTVPGEHQNQWKMYLRCGDGYMFDLEIAKGAVHRSEMKPPDAFHSVAVLPRTPYICSCARGLVTTIDVSLDERSDSSWELTFAGLYSVRVPLDTEGNPIGADRLKLAGANGATTFAANEPIRLCDLELELPSGGNNEDLMTGVCVYAQVEPTQLPD